MRRLRHAPMLPWLCRPGFNISMLGGATQQTRRVGVAALLALVMVSTLASSAFAIDLTVNRGACGTFGLALTGLRGFTLSTAPANGFVQQWNGSAWVNVASNGTIADANVQAPPNYDKVRYCHDATGGGANATSDLFRLTAAEAFNTTTGSWQPSGLTFTWNVTIIQPDLTAPTLTLTLTPGSPDGNNGWYKTAGGVQYQWTCFDASGIDNTFGSGCPSPLSGTITAQGETTLSDQVKDIYGNTSAPVSVTVKLDNVAPTLTLVLSPGSPDGSNGWYKTAGGVGFTWTCSGGTSGIDASFGGGCPSPLSGTVTAQGTTTISDQVRDQAGNLSASVNQSVKLDNVAPSLTLNPAADSCSLPGDNGWCRGTQTAGFTASDATSLLATVTASAPRETDVLARTRFSEAESDALAGGAPSVAGCSAGVTTCNFTRTTTTNGVSVNVASGVISDQAGNSTSSINAGPYKIDNAAPTLTLALNPGSPDGSNGWYKTPSGVGYEWTCSDATSGIDVSFNGGCPSPLTGTLTAQGSTLFADQVKDEAGNSSTSVSETVKLDNVAPTLERNVPADECTVPGSNGWCRVTQIAGFSASDGTSRLQAIGASGPIELDTLARARRSDPVGLGSSALAATCAAGELTCDFTVSTTTNGASVNVPSGAVSDQAGNSTASINAGPYPIDSVAPTLSLVLTPGSPDGSNGWYKTPGGVGYVWTCSDATSGIETTFNDGCPNPLTGTITAQGSTALADQVKDLAGNESASVNQTVMLDNVAPTLERNLAADECSLPGSNGWCRGAQTAGFTASDATSGLDSVGACVDGATTCDFADTSSTEGGAISIPSGTVSDLAGNSTASINAGPYQIDSVAPTLSLVLTPGSPDGSNGWYKTPGGVGYVWTCSDATSGIDTTFNDGCPNPLTGTITAQGSTTLADQVKDLAGNESVSIDETIKLDNVAPSLVLNPTTDICSVPGNNDWCRGTQTAGFTASDATSLLDEIVARGPAETELLARAHLAEIAAVGCTAGETTCNFTRSSSTNGSAINIPSGSVSDLAGNSTASINAGPYKIDSVAPALSLVVTPGSPDGSNGWYTTPTGIGFEWTCLDELSSIDNSFNGGCPDPMTGTVTAQGSTTLADQVKDVAGNESVSVSETVKLDNVAPSLVFNSSADACSLAGVNGWCRATQTAGFTASDATSSLDAITASAPLGPDSLARLRDAASAGCLAGETTCNFTRSSSTNSSATFIPSGSVSDLAGNSTASINAGPYKIDSVAPALSLVVTPGSPDGSNGWYTTLAGVGFEWACSDELSGIDASFNAGCPNPLTGTVTAQGSTALADQVKDQAGNESVAVSQTVKLDNVAPSLVLNHSADACSVPGINVWCRGVQTAGFTAADATSMLSTVAAGGPSQDDLLARVATGTRSEIAAGCASGVSTCNFTRSTATNGSSISIPSGSVTDLAGNSTASIDAGPYKIDSVAPSLSVALDPPTPDGPNGWFSADSGVSFQWSCSDALSGIDNSFNGGCPNPMNGAITDPGGTTLTDQVRDLAGNLSTSINVPVKLDNVIPILERDMDNGVANADSCSLVGLDGWCRGTQTAGFRAADPGSGLAGFPGCADGSRTCRFTRSTTTNGVEVVIFTEAIRDKADNVRTAVSAGFFKIDSVAPTVTCQGEPTFNVGQAGAVVTALVQDAVSGPLNTPITAPVDTNRPGNASIQLVGSDRAGNQTTVQCPARVRYQFSRVGNGPTAAPSLNAFKAGNTMTLKFSLQGDRGTDIFAAGTPVSVGFTCGSPPTDSLAPAGNQSAAAAAGEMFKLTYDRRAQAYTLTWKTLKPWKGSCRQLTIRLRDSQQLVLNFRFT